MIKTSCTITLHVNHTSLLLAARRGMGMGPKMIVELELLVPSALRLSASFMPRMVSTNCICCVAMFLVGAVRLLRLDRACGEVWSSAQSRGDVTEKRRYFLPINNIRGSTVSPTTAAYRHTGISKGRSTSPQSPVMTQQL